MNHKESTVEDAHGPHTHVAILTPPEALWRCQPALTSPEGLKSRRRRLSRGAFTLKTATKIKVPGAVGGGGGSMRAPPPPDPGRDHPQLGQSGQVSVWRWKTQWEPSSKHHQGLASSTRPGRGATESPDAAPGGKGGLERTSPNRTGGCM